MPTPETKVTITTQPEVADLPLLSDKPLRTRLDELTASLAAYERLAEAAREALAILKAAPELNARNFDADDAFKLNDAVGESFEIIETALASLPVKGTT